MYPSITIEPVTKKTRFRLRADAMAVPEPWRHPLPHLGDQAPIVLAKHKVTRPGVDLGYATETLDHDQLVPVYAAQSGEVTMAIQTSSGFAVSIDHGGWTWATHYAELAKLVVTTTTDRRRRHRQQVRAGEIIAYAANSPPHLRFELWQWTDDRGFAPVDPAPHMRDWLVLPTPHEFRDLTRTSRAA